MPSYLFPEKSKEKTEPNRWWIRYGLRLGVSAALHPFDYSKTLIQLGYEPVPPQQGTSLLGRPILLLPNILQYTAHVKKIDGFCGCYRGLAPKMVGSLISMVVSERLTQQLGFSLQEDVQDNSELSKEEIYGQFKETLKRDIVLTVSGIVVSHPFHVITVRMMAEFVGREKLYTSIIDSIVEIWKTEGVLGFFAGLVPKLLCDVVCVVLSSSTIYVLNKYLIKDQLARQYNARITQFAFSSWLYSLQVASTCSVVSGSRLIAGQPPIMPIYRNWVDCWKDLQCRGELKRGSSLFWRSQSLQSSSMPTAFISLPKVARYQ